MNIVQNLSRVLNLTLVGSRSTFRLLATLGIAALSGGESQAQTSSLPPQPWPNAQPITVSFAPDFVEVGRYRSELFQHFNSQMASPDWKVEICRALQTWSRYADVNFAIVPDSARSFGTVGLSQGDPRFGDIRLGAFPQQNVLGNAVPYNPAAGSWAGDILFDTNREFFIARDNSPDPSREQYDLYSVALHELGNSLGLLDNETDPESVMFFAYVGPRGDLTPRDIAELQALYGPPPTDSTEPHLGNETFQTATSIEWNANFPQTLQEFRQGRIQDSGDVDVYSFRGTDLAENCWLKVRGRGRSLLCPRLTAYDAQFNELATAAAESPLETTVIKEITGIAPGELIYIADFINQIQKSAGSLATVYGRFHRLDRWSDNRYRKTMALHKYLELHRKYPEPRENSL